MSLKSQKENQKYYALNVIGLVGVKMRFGLADVKKERKMKTRIISDINTNDFTEKLNFHLENGWELNGKTFSGRDEDGEVVLFQSIKEVENKDYVIVYNIDPFMVSRDITEYLNKGYKLHGSLIHVIREHVQMISQALVK